MQKTENTVVDGTKMTDEQLGKLTRRSDELKRCINEGTLPYDWVIDELQQVIEGRRSVFIILDCDTAPYIPSGLSLEGEGAKHCKMGKVILEKRDGGLYANGVKIVWHFSPHQKGGNCIQGYELRNELHEKRVLNACILDALLANPHLIPDRWKFGYTYFWGTIFSSTDGTLSLYVKYLFWQRRWGCNYYWLRRRWFESDPAAVLER